MEFNFSRVGIGVACKRKGEIIAVSTRMHPILIGCGMVDTMKKILP